MGSVQRICRMKVLCVGFLLVAAAVVQGQRGRPGRPGRQVLECADGERPDCTCEEPPCRPGSNPPDCTCADGSSPQVRAPCDDGSFPECPGACRDGSDAVFTSDPFDGPCADGSRPKMRLCECADGSRPGRPGRGK